MACRYCWSNGEFYEECNLVEAPNWDWVVALHWWYVVCSEALLLVTTVVAPWVSLPSVALWVFLHVVVPNLSDAILRCVCNA